MSTAVVPIRPLMPQLHISTVEQILPVVAPLSAEHERSNCRNKPYGGLWTSTYADGKSHWVEWLEGEWESQLHSNWFVLHPSPDARVLVIDEDSVDVIPRKQVPDGHFYPRRYNESGPIDWLALASEYDGVHLPRRCNHYMDPLYEFYGWDCESTVWFRWVFEKVERVK